MFNQFDFYVVQVRSTRKTDLKRAGVAAKDIKSERDGYKTYGYGMYARKFPQFIYVASVGYVDMAGKTVDEAQKRVAEIEREWKNKGCTTNVKYFAVD
ncbi:MAG: hypothetical protein WC567_03855 [Kiritimatiellia bacterium]|jgi:hypothetical protein